MKEHVWRGELYRANYRIIKTVDRMRGTVHDGRLLINTPVVVETIYDVP